MLGSDQAESLRRMLAPRVTRRIAVVGSEPGAGATTVALGLANALALQGERVLLVDEDRRGERATRLAGATPAATLADVLAGRTPLATALGTRPSSGVAVLPAGQVPAGATLDNRTVPDMRTVIIDACTEADGTLSATAGDAHNFVIVMRPEAASITAAYACIKRLHHLYACRRFHLIVNMATSEAAVSAITGNLARTAGQYLGVEATSAGALPVDPLVVRGLQLGRCVVEAFPAAAATTALRRVASAINGWPLRAETAAPRGMAAAMPA
ncbi:MULTISPECIES: MinD/ParA family ATP-binding protein [unclassified Cupriavidus]|uniref:MinD/ParA family ATP-binding protein n=1 Tax=Cupriavidus sp. H19C3 TaxID=3241603 RepID=UPI003BF7F68B